MKNHCMHTPDPSKFTVASCVSPKNMAFLFEGLEKGRYTEMHNCVAIVGLTFSQECWWKQA